MAGYSGTPLAQKLGIASGQRVAILHAPAKLAEALDLPDGVVVQRRLAGKAPFDVMLFFTKSRAELVDRLAALRARMAPAGALWIAWPKRTSGVPTDVTEDVVRAVALPTGLVDNKVCAIDEVWSGLRLVVRRALRTAPRRPAARR